MLALNLIGGVIFFWLTLGAAGLLLRRHSFVITQVIFPLGALGAMALGAAALFAIGEGPSGATLPLGLPFYPFHVRLDPLAALFLVALGLLVCGTSIFSAGYFRNMDGQKLSLLSLQYHVFIASMAMVIIADDAYFFMVGWETMALSSYFLVTTHHQVEANRKAGFIYLLIAHVGAIAILSSFGVLIGIGGDYTFDAMRGSSHTPFWASVTFGLALIGFGAKAGMLPLHVWLPDAHPAAPSPISALMSGIMLKTAIYGLIRVTYDLLGGIQWQWGLTVLIIGTLTALFGVLFALMQHDLKRLLAYSSIENIGIILLGVGLSMVYIGTGHPVRGAMALIAALYHSLNHAIYKGLLFLGAGAIQHATNEKSLSNLGGLIKVMPHTAFYFLVGALAISALPPLNGFVSEWLTFQSALLSPTLENSVLRSLIPASAAVLALSGALTAMAFVKVYGIAFLGQSRQVDLASVQEVSKLERAGMAWLTFICVVLSIFPVFVIHQLEKITLSLTGHTLRDSANQSWLWLTPVAPERASYSAPIFLVVILAVVLITYLVVRYLYQGKLRRAAPWDCGYPELNARMQDCPEGFGQPIRQIFDPVYEIKRHVPTPFDTHPYYELVVKDRFWKLLYRPVARLTDRISQITGKLQHGRIHLYLLYSFATLIALLMFVR